MLGRAGRHRRAAPRPDRRRARPRRDRRGVLPDGARRRVQRHARPARAARAPTSPMQREMGLSMADAIGALARVDLEAARAVPTSASPTGGASARCRGGASSSTATPSCPATRARRSRASTTSPRWLDEHRPTDIRMGLIHGDFHFANVLIDRRPRTGGGDRRLGADDDRRPAARPRPPAVVVAATRAARRSRPVAQATGMPTADEVIARYDGQVDRDLSRPHVVPGAGLLPARDHPRGLARPGVLRAHAARDRRPPARTTRSICSPRPPS